MYMELVDSHSHLFLEDFDPDLPQVMERARQAGISHIFIPNIDSTTIEPMLRVCSEYKEFCHPMIGLHPTSVTERFEEELEIVARYLSSFHDFVAIGEIGMDLYWDKTFLKEQQVAFERQICWAMEYGLPIVIHCREAFTYIYDVLVSYRNTPLRGIFHSFTGTEDEAARILEFPGFLIGINGIVTFKKSALPYVLNFIPLEKIVLETDSPYLAPVPHRGKRNESAYMLYTLQKVAELYGQPVEKVADTTSKNALSLFGLLK